MPFEFTLQNEVVQRALYILGTLLVIYVATRIIQRLARKYVDEPQRLYHTSKLIRRIGGLAALVTIVLFLSPDLKNLLTILTVIGAGIAIALREALLSFAGWFYIIFVSPFRPGDRIEVNGIQGDVIDVRVLRTTLMEIGGWVQADQSTGRIVHIPNSWVFLYGVFNYTAGFHFIWNEIAVTVTFRSDWEAAREIMLSLAEESAAIVEMQARTEIHKMSREYLIYYNILTPFVYVDLVSNGVRLTLRYLCEVRKRRGTAHALTMGMLKAFRERDDIEVAYAMTGVAVMDSPQFGPMPHPAPPSRSNDAPSHGEA